MKKIYLKFLVAWMLHCLSFTQAFSQNNPLNYSVELNSEISSEATLPFWMTANKFGAVPNSHHSSFYAALFSDIKASESDFSFSYKASFTGYLASKNDIFINELYGSLKHKGWQLDLGSKNDIINLEGLSSSNGNIIKSINARAFPGINLKTDGYIKLPFAKKWLRVKANYAEYLLNDKRVVDGAHLHHKSLYFKSILSEKFSMITGIDHYVQWSGTSEEFGKQPSSFKDYLRVITGSSGGESALEGDQINALGNSVSAYMFQLNYSGKKTNWSVYWSHLFEDRSGRELSNYPDALYGLFIDLKKPESFITHVLAEVTNTTSMSGSTGFSGRDNYFNNSYYGSGWTYFGNVIGTPFFHTKTPEDGITKGVDLNYSRFTAYHLGFKGFLRETIQYKTYLSYIQYPGWFNAPINEEQFSSLVEIYLQPKNIPFEITLGAAADYGDSLPKNFGGFLKLTKRITK
ncbi:MAG: capsule assembly Wzi family protein [Lutibacter sp.]|nr:capsule assembly Wzi family protein [Lutibacter sp.]